MVAPAVNYLPSHFHFCEKAPDITAPITMAQGNWHRQFVHFYPGNKLTEQYLGSGLPPALSCVYKHKQGRKNWPSSMTVPLPSHHLHIHNSPYSSNVTPFLPLQVIVEERHVSDHRQLLTDTWPPRRMIPFLEGVWNCAFLIRRLPGPAGIPSGPGERFCAPLRLILCGGH